MAEPLKLVPTGLLPEDQEREDMIVELRQIVESTHRPERERQDAWQQMRQLIAERPEYVVKKMEMEQGLT